jgi:hypothetical protein
MWRRASNPVGRSEAPLVPVSKPSDPSVEVLNRRHYNRQPMWRFVSFMIVLLGQADLSQGAAEYLLSIRFGERDVARMNELSKKVRQGIISSEEQAELDSYIHGGNLISLMQAARAQLS